MSSFFLGALTLRLEITDGRTLKDKRQVVRSLLDRLRSRFNVSAAEVGDLDSPRFATLAAAVVANEKAFLHQMLEKLADFVEAEPRAVLLERSVEVL
jgi:hypothetical protein